MCHLCRVEDTIAGKVYGHTDEFNCTSMASNPRAWMAALDNSLYLRCSWTTVWLCCLSLRLQFLPLTHEVRPILKSIGEPILQLFLPWVCFVGFNFNCSWCSYSQTSRHNQARWHRFYPHQRSFYLDCMEALQWHRKRLFESWPDCCGWSIPLCSWGSLETRPTT